MDLFVDESKANSYLLVAALVDSNHVIPTRLAMRAMALPNQRRIHMKNERRARRDDLIRHVAALPANCVVIDAGRRFPSERAARDACLEHLVGMHTGATSLTLEIDESLVASDRETLYRVVRRAGSAMRYAHAHPNDEPLLWLPDIVAWSWARGGRAREAIQPAVAEVVRIHP